jgi:hypothetical protein
MLEIDNILTWNGRQMHRTSMSIGRMDSGDMIGTSRTAPLTIRIEVLYQSCGYNPLSEVVGAEGIAGKQEEEKEVIVGADVEWEVEKENTSDTFAEHEYVQSDDMACLDTDVSAWEGGLAIFYF